MWIILSILAALFNALWTGFSKNRLKEISPFQFALLFRATTALILLPIFLYDFSFSLNIKFLLIICVAGFIEVFSIYIQSIGVKKDFYSTYSLSNTAPLFTLFLAPIFLPERLNSILIIGSILIVFGGIIFYRLNNRISIYGIIRGVCLSVAGILAKLAMNYTTGLSYPFIIFSIGSIFMLFISPFQKTRIKKEDLKITIAKLLPLAAFSAIATLCYYTALQIAPVTRVNPLIRINLLFGFVLSYFLLKERQDIKRKILASILIMLGAILISMSL